MGAPTGKLQVSGPKVPQADKAVLTESAAAFLVELHQRFEPRRQELLKRRSERQAALRSGQLPDFLPETSAVRSGTWQVGPTPADLQDRRVEITGPAEAKMIINALNCGAKAFMCDFEDSLSPTWNNILSGQQALQAAVRRTLSFTNEAGKSYNLNDKTATLLVRPRGWHLPEKHLQLDGTPLSGSLVDFGLYFFHNAKELVSRGSGPYFYLPKMESHLEARLWNDVFVFAQEHVGLPRGTIKATVLIETIMAAFEMDEILHELKDHITGLNAGRWDYIFSIIKKFSHDQQRQLPDRSQITMAVPFMRSYCDLLVQTCHKRGAHAMGGMAAFIPSRRDAEVNRIALAKVREDKERETKQGFDGTWVAHPDLVQIATTVFDETLGKQPNQKTVLRADARIQAQDLLNLDVPGGKVTEAGVLNNINVALQYLENWLAGTGAVALHNLMEDAATAEISRAQLWQWIKAQTRLVDGRRLTADLYRQLRQAETARLGDAVKGRAIELFDALVLAPEFGDFLTLPAYAELDS